MIPLTEQTFLILLSLATGEKHGYAILQDVAKISRNRIKLSTSTLYMALERMLLDGWIEQLDIKYAPRRRKTYRLTTRGQKVIEAETKRLTALSRLARRRLGEMP